MSASKAELWTQVANAIKISDTLFQAVSTSSPSVKSLIDVLEQSYEGNHIIGTSAGVNSLRSSLSANVNYLPLLNSLIIELGKNGYSSLATSASAALDDIAKGMDAASETIAERDMTFGTIAAGGSNVGSGTVYRMTTDQYGNNIESGSINGGVTKIEIVSDKNTGRTPGTEQATIYGLGRTPVDNIDFGDAPNGTATLTALRASDGLLTNGGFETSSSTAPTLVFTGWTPGTIGNFTGSSTAFRGDQSISFEDNDSITQHILTAGSSIDKSKPVFLIVRFNRVSSCDGTLTIRLGSQTTDVTLSAQSGWTDVAMMEWYDDFKEDNSALGFRVAISLASRTTGTLLIDGVVLAQPTKYDGKWYLMVAGSDSSDFLIGDYFTFTDSVAGSAGGTGRIQATINRLYGKHLPSTSGTPTYADA